MVVSGGALALLGRLVDTVTFGLYGVAWSAVALGYTVSQSGAAQGIIAMREVEKGHLSAGHALSIGLSSAMALGLVVLAPLVEHFYDLEGLRTAFVIGGALIPLMCLPAVDVAVAQKDLRFGRLALIRATAATLSAVTAVILAWLGHGLLGLFALQGGIGPFSFVLFRAVGQPLHLTRFGWRHVKDVWRIGGHLSFNSLTVVLLQNLPQLILAKLVDATALGYFAYCLRIIQVIGTQLMGMVNTVVYPTFASICSDLERVGRTYLVTARYTALGVFLTLLVLTVAPASFLELYGGPQWVPAGEILLYLAVMQALFALGSNIFSTFLAVGRPSAAWRWTLFLSALQGLTVLVLGRRGVVAAAQGLALTGLVWPMAAFWLSKVLGFPFRSYVRTMAGSVLPLIPALSMGLIVAEWVDQMSLIYTFMFPTLTAITVCIGFALAFDVRLRTQLAELIPGRWSGALRL